MTDEHAHEWALLSISSEGARLFVCKTCHLFERYDVEGRPLPARGFKLIKHASGKTELVWKEPLRKLPLAKRAKQ